jgi:competence protein CoiA
MKTIGGDQGSLTALKRTHEAQVCAFGRTMKFALINGRREEAQPNLAAACPVCNSLMVAKCGEVKLWHWAHHGSRLCDHWWENETEWHRTWKGRFPTDWQEVVQRAESGEKHVSDVKTDRGWVIEFQRSYLKPEERRSRDMFYPKLIWVVDGTRRTRDAEQLLNAWRDGTAVGGSPNMRKTFSDSCLLLREWTSGKSPVFFDLGEEQVIWWLIAPGANGFAYVTPYSRAQFIKAHRSAATEQAAREFDGFINDVPKLVAAYESSVAMRRLEGIQRYPRPNNRPRRRL